MNFTWTYVTCPHCGHTTPYRGPAEPGKPYYCMRCARGCVIPVKKEKKEQRRKAA